MKLLARLPLLLVMLWLTFHSVFHYGFAFEEGYPLWPLLGLAVCFRAYVRMAEANPSPRPVVYVGSMMDSALLFILAVLSSIYLLQMRHDKPLTAVWGFHLAILICLQLLVPWIAAYTVGGAKTAVTALVSLLLVLTLWKGSDSQRGLTKSTGRVLGLMSAVSEARSAQDLRNTMESSIQRACSRAAASVILKAS